MVSNPREVFFVVTKEFAMKHTKAASPSPASALRLRRFRIAGAAEYLGVTRRTLAERVNKNETLTVRI